mmetsp:Transcript_17510/g.67926  ORF Transcript_17510/g.67926 Transcript_17510/m.67926 type:complete len:401 (+) Transcript_17510:289-1491(+)
MQSGEQAALCRLHEVAQRVNLLIEDQMATVVLHRIHERKRLLVAGDEEVLHVEQLLAHHLNPTDVGVVLVECWIDARHVKERVIVDGFQELQGLSRDFVVCEIPALKDASRDEVSVVVVAASAKELPKVLTVPNSTENTERERRSTAGADIVLVLGRRLRVDVEVHELLQWLPSWRTTRNRRHILIAVGQVERHFALVSPHHPSLAHEGPSARLQLWLGWAAGLGQSGDDVHLLLGRGRLEQRCGVSGDGKSEVVAAIPGNGEHCLRDELVNVDVVDISSGLDRAHDGLDVLVVQLLCRSTAALVAHATHAESSVVPGRWAEDGRFCVLDDVVEQLLLAVFVERIGSFQAHQASRLLDDVGRGLEGLALRRVAALGLLGRGGRDCSQSCCCIVHAAARCT